VATAATCYFTDLCQTICKFQLISLHLKFTVSQVRQTSRRRSEQFKKFAVSFSSPVRIISAFYFDCFYLLHQSGLKSFYSNFSEQYPESPLFVMFLIVASTSDTFFFGVDVLRSKQAPVYFVELLMPSNGSLSNSLYRLAPADGVRQRSIALQRAIQISLLVTTYDTKRVYAPEISRIEA